MKKLLQTRIDPQYGNCLQTAVACVLDMEIENVPAFMENGVDGGRWFEKLWNFLHAEGYDMTMWVWNDAWRQEKLDPEKFYIVQGKSPRGGYDHCVIYKGKEPYWDVHPDAWMLDGNPKHVYLLEKIKEDEKCKGANFNSQPTD